MFMKQIIFLLIFFLGAVNAQSQRLVRYQSGKNKYGFKDFSGKIIIEPVYEDAESFSDGMAEVKLKGKFGFIDYAGKVVIPIKYDFISSPSEGFFTVRIQDKYG